MIEVSVIMCAYKEPLDFLRKAVESILTQSFLNFEFIIILDNPRNDELLKYLKEIQRNDSRIVIIVNDDNIGLTKSLNKGLEIAKGKYVARMDADDISLPNRLETQYHYMERHPEIDILNTDVFMYNSSKVTSVKKSPVNHNDIIKVLFYANVLNHPAVMIRMNTLRQKSISYNESFRRSQDYCLWLTMAIKGCRFHSLNQPLLMYRYWDGQITKKNREEQLSDYNAIKRYAITSILNETGIKYEEITPRVIENAYKSMRLKHIYDLIRKCYLFQMCYSLSKKDKLTCIASFRTIKYGFDPKFQTILFLSLFIKRWDKLFLLNH